MIMQDADLSGAFIGAVLIALGIFIGQIVLGAVIGAYFGRKLPGSSPGNGARWGGLVGAALLLVEFLFLASAARWFSWFFSPFPLSLGLVFLVANTAGAAITYGICREQGQNRS